MFWIKRWVIAGAGFFRPRRLRRFVPQAVDPTRLAAHLARTTVDTLRNVEAVNVDLRAPTRWGPSLFQRINPANLRRESNRERPSSD